MSIAKDLALIIIKKSESSEATRKYVIVIARYLVEYGIHFSSSEKKFSGHGKNNTIFWPIFPVGGGPTGSVRMGCV